MLTGKKRIYYSIIQAQNSDYSRKQSNILRCKTLNQKFHSKFCIFQFLGIATISMQYLIINLIKF